MESDKIICLFCASPCLPNFTPVTVDTILVKKEVEFIAADTDDDVNDIKPDDHGDAQFPGLKGTQGQDQAIQSQLKAFLILTKILKVSNETLCQFLQHDNGQDDKVNVCSSCGEQVDQFSKVLKTISSLEWKLDQLRLILMEKIRLSKDLETGDICGVIRREVLNNSEEEALTTQEDDQTVLITLEPFDNSSEELVQGTTFVGGDLNAQDLSATQPLHAYNDVSSLLFLNKEVDADRNLLPDDQQPPPVIDSIEPPRPPSLSSNAAAGTLGKRKMEEYPFPKSSNYRSMIRKRTRKSLPKTPVKTVDEDFNVQLEFIDVVKACEDKSAKGTSIKREVEMIIPDDEEPTYSTPSMLVLNGHLKVASDKLQVSPTSNDVEPTDGNNDGCVSDAIVPFPSFSNLATGTLPKQKAHCYYRCDFCPYETNNKIRLAFHNLCHETGSGAIICTHCGQYHLQEKMGRHLTVVHGYPAKSRKRSRKSPPRPVKTVDEVKLAKDVHVQHKPKPKKYQKFKMTSSTTTTSVAATTTCKILCPLPQFYNCGICPFSSSSVVRFRTHMQVHDFGSDAISCGDCGRFVMLKNFRRHQARWHQKYTAKKAEKSSGNNTTAASTAIVNGNDEEVDSNSLFLDFGWGSQEVVAAPDENVSDANVAQVIQTGKKPELDWNGDKVEKKVILGTVHSSTYKNY